MKKLLIGVFLTVTTYTAFAQQDPQFTQFFRTKLYYNPAFAGSHNDKDICVGLIGREQWLGFGSSSKGQTPSTYAGDIHTPLFNNRIGVGLNILRDAQGFEGTLMPTFSFAYHHTFANSSKLSAGVGVGIIQKSLDQTKLKALDQGDPLIGNEQINGNSLDVNFGLYYQIPTLSIFDNVYMGLSSAHINQAKVEYGNIKYTATRHYYFMAGGVYQLTSDFTLEPNIFVKNAVKTSFDINVMSTYQEKLMGGLTYRNIDAIALLLGYRIMPKTTAMFSYDLTTSRLSQFSNGTVELSVRHCFGVKYVPKEKPVRPIYTPRFL